MEQTNLELNIKPTIIPKGKWDAHISLDGTIYVELIINSTLNNADVSVFKLECDRDLTILNSRNMLNKEKHIAIIGGILKVSEPNANGVVNLYFGDVLIATFARMTTTISIDLSGTTSSCVYTLVSLVRKLLGTKL